MPIRLFGGRGSDKVRSCPACEQEVAATATFCPSCYMVFRPEGAADLREHLQGGRIPSDVYLLRKMQAEDPNTGPVVRVPGEASVSPPPAIASPTPPARSFESAVTSPVVPPELPVARAIPPSGATLAEGPIPPPLPTGGPPSEPPAPDEAPLATVGPAPPAAAASAQPTDRPRAPGRTGVEILFEFKPPLPPPTRSIEEAPGLFAWMLDQDPIIPNNLDRLQEIHAGVFRDKPAGRLEYEQHVVLQIADDLALHPARDAMELHLMALVAGYRRAAGAYHVAARSGEQKADTALWQMASMASRLRVEAWIYQTRHGIPPELTRRGRLRIRRVTGD
jgi:hypothetical protein